MGPLCTIIYLYVICIWARVILSWFPLTPGTTLSRANELLFRVTEPVLGPVRRVMPSTGMIDFSPLVATLLIQFVVLRLLGC